MKLPGEYDTKGFHPHVADNLRSKFEDDKIAAKIFVALCGVPMAANEAALMMTLAHRGVVVAKQDS